MSGVHKRVAAGSLFLVFVCVLMVSIMNVDLRVIEASETKTETEIQELISAADIVQGRHNREPEYMADFATHSLSIEQPSDQIGYSLHMADSIYEEAVLRNCALTLWRDLTGLEKASGAALQEVTVYLVIDVGSSYPVNIGTQVFCTLNDFESGAYREALCSAAYGLTTAWQTAGLTAYAFNTSGDIDLAAYYAGQSHVLTASCSALHLSPLISDELTVRAARETARDLTAYLIEQEGFESFCEAADPLEKIPDWQKSKGISIQLPEGRKDTALLKVYPKSKYLAEVSVNNLRILLQEDSWLKDPDGLFLWIQDYYAGMELVTDQIREEAPSAVAGMEQHLAEPVQIIFGNENTYSYTDTWRNEIMLSRGNAVWHEMVHLLLEEYVPNDDLWWECEAIAEHFSHAAETAYAPTMYIAGGLDAYVEFFEEVSGKKADADDMVFHNEVWRLYQEFADPAWSGRDDLAAFCHAYGISSLVLDGKIERTQYRIKYDQSIAGKRGKKAGNKDSDGNALSYPEAEVLFDYLAEIYGLDSAVDAYMNGLSPEKAFGISYPALLTEAEEYYAEQYGIAVKQE